MEKPTVNSVLGVEPLGVGTACKGLKMKFIKLYAKDDEQAIERAKRFADEQGIIPVIAHTTTGDTFLTYAQIDPDGKDLIFETDSWDDETTGKVMFWSIDIGDLKPSIEGFRVTGIVVDEAADLEAALK
nr:MAG TPA: hypothetical protein [Caudoviricetes sp.]